MNISDGSQELPVPDEIEVFNWEIDEALEDFQKELVWDLKTEEEMHECLYCGEWIHDDDLSEHAEVMHERGPLECILTDTPPAVDPEECPLLP
jgi:hypothetical protein